MENSRQGFVLASVIHVGFFGALGLAIFLQQLKREPEPVVLTLVAPPPSAPMSEQPPSPEPEPAIQTPQLEPMKPVDIPDIPEPPPPEPPPPEPRPEPPSPKPEPKPEPKSAPRMSLEEFRRQHGAPPDTATRTVQPKPKRPPAPRIDVSGVTSALEQILENSEAAQSSEAEQRALLAYVQRLRRQLELTWQKPQTANPNEWLEVSITVSPDGTISGFKIVSKNCGQEFIRSVSSAIQSARSIGPTPTGRTLVVRQPFRLTDA